MSRDTLLMLEDSDDRLDRFRAVVAKRFPTLRLVTWPSAVAMVAELEYHLPTARLISLDHDLEPVPGGSDPGDGLNVAKWMAERPPACPVIIHTSNIRRGDAMEGELDLAGWTYRRVPPIGDDWIEVDWRFAVRDLLRAPRKGNRP